MELASVRVIPNLATLVVAARDLFEMNSNVKERSLAMLSDLVAGISGIAPAPNAPVIGQLSAIQGCGVHADGDKKGNLYQNKLDPKRFGLKRSTISARLLELHRSSTTAKSLESRSALSSSACFLRR